VLRDFSLQLVDDAGSAITSREYLERALRPQVSGRQLEQKNRIRQVLSTVFPRRDCETLVRPVLDEKELQQLTSVPHDKLRREFRDGMDKLRNKVFRLATPKTVDGHFVNGAALVLLAQAYTQVRFSLKPHFERRMEKMEKGPTSNLNLTPFSFLCSLHRPSMTGPFQQFTQHGSLWWPSSHSRLLRQLSTTFGLVNKQTSRHRL